MRATSLQLSPRRGRELQGRLLNKNLSLPPLAGGVRRGKKIQLNYPSLSPQKTSDQLSRFQKNFFMLKKEYIPKTTSCQPPHQKCGVGVNTKGWILAYLSQKEMFLACFWAPKKT